MAVTETTGTRTMGYPVRQKSANGQPKPETSIERCCRTCRASFIGLAPGKTGETGIWHDWHWYCSARVRSGRMHASSGGGRGDGEGMTETGTETTGHGYAYCCEVCDGTDPHWHIMRRGDVVVSWACDDHLAAVCGRLQRDHEVTTLLVSDSRKARGRAETARLARGEDERRQAVAEVR